LSEGLTLITQPLGTESMPTVQGGSATILQSSGKAVLNPSGMCPFSLICCWRRVRIGPITSPEAE